MAVRVVRQKDVDLTHPAGEDGYRRGDVRRGDGRSIFRIHPLRRHLNFRNDGAGVRRGGSVGCRKLGVERAVDARALARGDGRSFERRHFQFFSLILADDSAS